mmetsp:Transcript_38167/g.92061  ORF Transcript_38167/g.92061 Transcript_38167/m.92061 type:complete len:215 (-) Transcript_38167:55-699(-)
MLDNSLSINSLLGQEASSGKHRESAVLKLLCNHQVELLGILGPQAKGIKSNVSWVVIITQKSGLIVRGIGGGNPTNLSTLSLGRTDEGDNDGIPSTRNLGEVGDGRAGDLRIKKEGASLDGLSNEESEGGKHCNAAVRDLSLTVTLQSLLVGLLSEAKRIEESHGSEGARHAVCGEGVHGSGRLADGCGGECGGRAGEKGGDGKLHHFFVGVEL